MHTYSEIKSDLAQLGVLPTGTLLVHSSMKAIGEVKGRADTVLNAFIDYMKPGLLVFPTHTWDRINLENPVYDVLNTPSCVGILGNLFLRRPGVIRS